MTSEARRRRQIRTPVLVVAALAWAATVVMYAAGSGSADQPGNAAGMAGMAGMAADSPSAGPTGSGMFPSPAAFLAGWPVMLAAMMAPLLIPALRHAHTRSLPGRRRRALTLLVASYAVPWLVAGFVLQGLALWLRAIWGPAAVLAGLLFVLAWQFSPAKQRCLNRHHAHPPLAAFGRAADLAAARFGWVQAS